MFLPAKLWGSWKVLYGNSWSLASGQTPDFELEGSRYTVGFVLVFDFLRLLGSWIPVLV